MIGKTNWNPDISGIQIKYMDWKMSEYWTKWSAIQTPFVICTIHQLGDSFRPFQNWTSDPYLYFLLVVENYFDCFSGFKHSKILQSFNCLDTDNIKKM